MLKHRGLLPEPRMSSRELRVLRAEVELGSGRSPVAPNSLAEAALVEGPTTEHVFEAKISSSLPLPIVFP